MSLKSFHLVFIIASILLSGFLSYWSLHNQVSDVLSWISGAVSLVLAIYGVNFVVKAKNIIT
jgi:hypothetical protein